MPYKPKHFYQGMPLKQYCLIHKIRYGTVIARMKLKGLTIDEALNYKPNACVYYTSKGESLAAVCQRKKIHPGVVYNRMRRGQTVDQALRGLPTKRSSKQGSKLRKWWNYNAYQRARRLLKQGVQSEEWIKEKIKNPHRGYSILRHGELNKNCS